MKVTPNVALGDQEDIQVCLVACWDWKKKRKKVEEKKKEEEGEEEGKVV